MRTKLTLTLTVLVLMVSRYQARAQGMGFTYQGRLNNNGAAVSGTYNVRFTLFNTNSGGVAVAGPVTNMVAGVTNGLFTTMIDFGAGVFAGHNEWLEVAVRTNGSGSFTTLAPRQAVTPTPYAITAENLAGAITVQNNTNNAPDIIGGSPLNFVGSTVVGATIGGGGGIDPIFGPATNSVVGSYGTVGGGKGNTAGGYEGATVGGGEGNTAYGQYSTVGGGKGNSANGIEGGTIGGGEGNTASGQYTTVSGGNANTASGTYATVGGGYENSANLDEATVGGGRQNAAVNVDAVVGGGTRNYAGGIASTVPGGVGNRAGGNFSFAAGQYAYANHDGSFVWSDNSGVFSSTTNNQFAVHAYNGVRLVGNVTTGDISLSEGTVYHHVELSGGNSLGFIYGSYPKYQDFISMGYNYYADNSGSGHIPNTGGGTSRVSVGYNEVVIAVGDVNTQPMATRLDATLSGVTVIGSFNNESDRNAKQDFAVVSRAELLDKVLQLPLSQWSYKVDPKVRHIGPMAQDFHGIFDLGADDKHIAPIDEGGIAFAAIQGLNEKMEGRSQKSECRMQKLETENAELKRELTEIKELLKTLSANKK